MLTLVSTLGVDRVFDPETIQILVGAFDEGLEDCSSEQYPFCLRTICVWGGVAMRDSHAQMASEKPVQHKDMDGHPGHHTGSASDGAFHRSFEDADVVQTE